jgi:hypothetical protein
VQDSLKDINQNIALSQNYIADSQKEINENFSLNEQVQLAVAPEFVKRFNSTC